MFFVPQKKFQQKHLAAVKASTTASVGGADLQPVAPVRRLAAGQQQQRKAAGSGGGTGPAASDDGDALVQVDVKGKVGAVTTRANFTDNSFMFFFFFVMNKI